MYTQKVMRWRRTSPTFTKAKKCRAAPYITGDTSARLTSGLITMTKPGDIANYTKEYLGPISLYLERL